MPDSSHSHASCRRLRTRLPCAALLACICLLLTACSNLPRRLSELRSPDVQIAQVALEKADLLAPEFRLTLRVDNPNDEEIQIDGADAQLNLDGEPAAEGASATPLHLKAHEQSEVDIRATANSLTLARQLLKLDQQGRLAYVVTGHLTLAKWLGILGNVPFRVSGTLTREELFREIQGITDHGF